MGILFNWLSAFGSNFYILYLPSPWLRDGWMSRSFIQRLELHDTHSQRLAFLLTLMSRQLTPPQPFRMKLK